MRVDLLHLCRSLRRSPASAATAVLTLSLTLGVGASIFAVADDVLLTPLPFANPTAISLVGAAPIDESRPTPRAVGYATFEAWRERAGSLATLEAFDSTNLTLTELGPAERVSATDVTPGFFALLGVAPERGRTFESNETGHAVAIVSHAFWRGALNMDPQVLGRQIVLGGRAHTIIGVLPEAFSFALNPSDVWRLLPLPSEEAARAAYRVRVLARTAPNVPEGSLRAALDEVSRRSSPPAQVAATPISTAITGDARGTLGLLAGAAGLAMLVAFANLAGLLIVRAIDRRRELAVRAALGASQAEITRQLVLEAEALVAMGVAGGVFLAWWTTPLLGRLALEQFGAATREIGVSWRSIVAVATIAATCAGICGLLTGRLSTKRAVIDVLRRGVTPHTRDRAWRRVLVIGEVAVAFVLLMSMALVGRSLLTVLRVNPGFDDRDVMTMRVALPAAGYGSNERVSAFYSQLEDALAQRLGAGTAAVVDELPLTGDRGRSVVVRRPTDGGREAVVRTIGSTYLDVMRIPMLAGRVFTRHDDVSAPLRAVVSERLAKRLFASEQPVGRQIWLGARAQPAEIIGVSGDVAHRALDEPPSETVYLSAWQSPSRNSHVVVRSTRSDAEIIADVRSEVARLDRDLPVYAARRMHDVVAGSPGVPARTLLTAMFIAFAILAASLAGIGLFGIVAHDVASRRLELALRIALGADPARLLRATLGQGALLVGAGLVVGGLFSVWTTRVIGSAIIATGRADLFSVVGAVAVLMLVGVGAVLPAARRAAHTDPLIALRSE